MMLFALCGLFALTAAGQRGRSAGAPLSLSYMLPRASFEVAVTLECTERVPGPFSAYAPERLGVRPSITSAGQSWRIVGIRVTPVAAPDEGAMFTLSASSDHAGLQLSLTPGGFLAGVGSGAAPSEEPRALEYVAPPAPAREIEYIRFGVESTLKEVLDSNFSTMEIDGVPQRVWDPIVRHALKDNEDYAREITAELFATRRKRLEGMASAGGLTGESIAGLKALEEAYLSLFLGKETSREVTRVFRYIPERADAPTPLFRFSAERGIARLDDVSATPYLAEVTGAIVAKPAAGETAAARPGITYRVPAMATLRVRAGETTLFEGPCIVPQLGRLEQIPLDAIANEGLTIEFHPHLGSIKRISKK